MSETVQIYKVRDPQGVVRQIRGPVGAKPEEVIAQAQALFGGEQTPQAFPVYDPTMGESTPAGGGKLVADSQTGSENFLSAAGGAMRSIPRGIGQTLGMVPQASVDETAARDKPLLNTDAGMAGNITGNVAAMLPTALIPGANTITGAGVIGGLSGAAQPVPTGESRGQNAAMGVAGGLGGGMLARGLGRSLSPQTAPGARLLLDEGVTPTPGQIMGGRWQGLEDKMTSIPFIGDAISSARSRGLDEFNRAAYNRALAPIGQRSGADVGHEGVAAVRGALQDAYDRLLPHLSFRADPQFAGDVNRIQAMAASLPPQQSAQFDRVLAEQVRGKMTPNGLMNGERLKEVESELGRLSRGYEGDPSFDNRQLGAALTELQSSIRQTVARANPAHAEELGRINEGWANYTRIRDAAGRVGSQEGRFTPQALAGAVKRGDRTVGDRASSEGTALMQDLSGAGRSTLASQYPDSGTAGRALLATALGGGGAMAAGAMSNPVTATTAAMLATALGAYLPGGRQAAAALLARRPEMARQLGELISRSAPQAGAAGSAALLGGTQ